MSRLQPSQILRLLEGSLHVRFSKREYETAPGRMAELLRDVLICRRELGITPDWPLESWPDPPLSVVESDTVDSESDS